MNGTLRRFEAALPTTGVETGCLGLSVGRRPCRRHPLVDPGESIREELAGAKVKVVIPAKANLDNERASGVGESQSRSNHGSA